MRTRLKDLAEHLNLSAALVSGVLNQRANVWASDETRSRILAAARELNYGNGTAPKLVVDAKGKMTALVLGGLPSELPELVSVMGQGLVQFGVSDRIDAPALLYGSTESRIEAAELFTACGVPFVVKGTLDGRPDWRQVDFNHSAMATSALDHLRVLGHRNIGHVRTDVPGGLSTAFQAGMSDWHQVCFGVPMREEFHTDLGGIDTLLTLPAKHRPTAWIVTGGNPAWVALRSALARHKQTVGFREGGTAVTGVAPAVTDLAGVEALVFDLASMVSALVRTAQELLLEKSARRACIVPRLGRPAHPGGPK